MKVVLSGTLIETASGQISLYQSHILVIVHKNRDKKNDESTGFTAISRRLV